MPIYKVRYEAPSRWHMEIYNADWQLRSLSYHNKGFVQPRPISRLPDTKAKTIQLMWYNAPRQPSVGPFLPRNVSTNGLVMSPKPRISIDSHKQSVYGPEPYPPLPHLFFSVITKHHRSVPPQSHGLVLPAAPHHAPVGAPVDGVHLVAIAWQVVGQLAGTHVPALERRVFQGRH